MAQQFIHRLGALAAILSLVTLTACVNTPDAHSKLPPAPKNVAPKMVLAPELEPYRLQVGDVMDVKVMLNPEMNDQVTVRPDGFISTTIARDIKAYGRTPAELQGDLEEAYKDQLNDPKISVVVRSFAPNRVYVTGEVYSPGEFITVGPNLTLLQAIARAGGVKNSAGTDKIIIIRRGAGEKPEAYKADYDIAASGLDAASDVRLAPYDVVYVPRSDVGNAFLNFQQYLQQFIPASFGVSYQINPNNN